MPFADTVRETLTDLRYSLRALGASPQFTFVALLVLALGIGANAAIFSVVNGVLLRPLPFHEPDRLVLLSMQRDRDAAALPFSFPDYFDVRDQSRSFDALGAWSFGRGNVAADEPEQVLFAVATANFFSILGVTPEIGPGFVAADDRPGARRVAVISRGLWQRRFGSSPTVVGRPLSMDGRVYEIAGVLPASFRFLSVPRDTDVWLAAGSDPFTDRRYARGLHSAGVLGRLKNGVTLAQAQADVGAIAARLAAAYPGDNRGRGMAVMSLREQVVKNLRPAILVLLGAVGCVLLIACANVANLLLARATSRSREMAIRAALGAARGRLIRQLLAEHIMLALAGGALGLLVAASGVRLLSALPQGVPNLFVPYMFARQDVGVDWAVVAFTAALAVATAVLFGLSPAIDATRLHLVDSLKAGGHATATPHASRMRATLLVAEIALSVMLLAGAGLLLRTFVQLRHVDLGFNPDRVLTFDVSLSPSKYASPAQTIAFFDALIARLRAHGAVTAVGATEFPPLAGADSATPFYVEGRPRPAPGESIQAHYRSVTPDYFAAIGMTVVSGRGLTDRDGGDAPRVAVISETMARQHWPNQNPIGQRLAITIEALRFRRNAPPDLDLPSAMREIVGIVADVKHASVQGDSLSEVYIPFAQRPVGLMSLVVRTTGDPLALAADARRAAAALDPAQPISNVNAVSNIVAASIAQPRFNVVLLSAFAAVALVLALAGVYGVLSYSVALRTREIGVRLALGGQSRDIAALVVGGGMRLAAIGLAIGVGGALAGGRVLSGLLFGVTPTDPIALAGAAALVTIVAFAACYLPARRAMRIDPIVALRSE
jgi:putative ABC transport system permease protein